MLKQRVEFYIDNEYKVKTFNRISKYPQSVLSSVLFGNVVEGDKIFKTVLNEIL